MRATIPRASRRSKGKITKRTIVVTPKSSDEVELTYGHDVAKKLASGIIPTNINELPTTCVAPTIEGSMELTDTTNDAVVTVYNAGTYNVALGNSSLTGASAGNYQLELATTPITWTINRKLLTKVKNSGLLNSGFGANTDKGIIDAVWNDRALDGNGGTIGDVHVSNIVGSKDKLSFPADTKCFITGSGATEKKYPMPGEGKTKTYTLVVTNPGRVEVGDNYYVDKDTVYEFQYDVSPINASLLTVTLTEDTYTYNGMEQGPTVSVTYTANDTLDLTSISNISGARATNAATYTINVTAPTVATGTQTAKWKINQKNIADSSITINQTTNVVYDGMKKTLNGSLLTVTDTAIGQNGGTKLWMGERNDYTVNSIEGTDANEDAVHAADYQLTVTGQGNYTGTKTFNATIKKFVGTVEKPLLSTSISRNQVTRGKTTTLYIDTAVLLKDGELGESGAQVDGKVTWTVEKNTPGATVTVERVEKQKKLKVTVEVPNGATPDENNPQIIITLRPKFAESHQNITSGQSCTYNLHVTDKEQQENFKIDQGESGTYSYSQGGVQLTTSGKRRTAPSRGALRMLTKSMLKSMRTAM